MNKNNLKVTVVGAGIIGVTIACILARQGMQITLIDRDAPGLGASYGNAGHFATEQIFPLANPFVLGNIPRMLFDRSGPLVLKPSYMLRFLPWSLRFLWASRPEAFRRGVTATKSLNDPALTCWQDLLTDLGLSSLIRNKGSVEIFQTEQAFANSPALAAQFKAYDVATEIWNEKQVRERIPALSGQVKGALFFPKTGHTLNPHRLLTEIFDKAMDEDIYFLQEEITHVRPAEDDRVVLSGKLGQYTSDKLILASGIASKNLAKTLGLHIPLEAERGYHYMLPSPGISVDFPVSFHEKKFILTPMEHGIRLAGTVEFAGVEAPPTPNRARMLYQFARNAFPELRDTEAAEWMGCRPTLPDYLPIIDQRDNIIHTYGHNHLGLTQAAITAQLVAEMVKGDKPSIDLSPFALDRF